MIVTTSYNGFGPRIRSDSFVWMKREITEGRVPPPSRCLSCGETESHLDYHTEDYSRPFGPHVYGFELCFRCHMMLHARFRRPTDWQRYIQALEAGAVYEPLMSRREIFKVNGGKWIDQPVRWGEPRAPLAFFRGLSTIRVDEIKFP